MNRFKWKFEGVEAIFSSTEDSHAKDIFTAAKMLRINPETKIEYHDQINRPTLADTFRVDSNSAADGEPTVPVGTKKSRAKQEASELPDVYGDVAGSAIAPDTIFDASSLGGDCLPGDSVADDADGEIA
jgi:hypothetical protein